MFKILTVGGEAMSECAKMVMAGGPDPEGRSLLGMCTFSVHLER